MAPALIGALLLAGCSSDGSLFGADLTTASVPETPKVDPACVTLMTQIEGMRKEGIADKVEKAAVKKYKMTAADLAKADQLNKANAEFQSRCAFTPARSGATTASVATPGASAR